MYVVFISRDEHSLTELGGAAQDVTKALNDLLNHIKDGGPDKIPDIMDQIMVASGELIASHDSSDMVRQARILAQATAELIQAIKGEAESQSDSDLQVRPLVTLQLPRVGHLASYIGLGGIYQQYNLAGIRLKHPMNNYYGGYLLAGK